MIKAALLAITCLVLTACAIKGVSPDTPMIAIGPKAERAGIFSGKEGAFTGAIKTPGNSQSESKTGTQAATEAAPGQPVAAPATTTGGNVSTAGVTISDAEYAEFQAWKKARQQEEFDAWKKAREQEEFEAWKSSRETQQP